MSKPLCYEKGLSILDFWPDAGFYSPPGSGGVPSTWVSPCFLGLFGKGFRGERGLVIWDSPSSSGKRNSWYQSGNCGGFICNMLQKDCSSSGTLKSAFCPFLVAERPNGKRQRY